MRSQARSSAVHRPITLVWAYFAAYTAWVGLILWGEAPRGGLNDIFFLPFYVGAGLAALAASQSSAVGSRAGRGWRYLGGAWLVSGLGAILWLANWWWPSELLNWSAWGAYNLYYPLVLVGLWHLVELPIGGAARIRLVIEGVIVVLATAVLAWYFVFRFDEAFQTLPRFIKSMGTLFVGEGLVVFAATATLHRPGTKNGITALTCLSVGLFAAAVADFLYEHDRLFGRPWSASVGDLVLAAGAGLVMSAAFLARGRTPVNDPGRQEVVSRGLTVLPYLAIAVVAGLLLFELERVSPPRPIEGLVGGGALLLVLVIARLLAAQRELLAEATRRTTQDVRFSHLVQQSSDGVLIVTRGGVIRYASPAFGRLVSADETALPGRRLEEFVDGDQAKQLADWLVSGAAGATARWRMGAKPAWREIEAVTTDLSLDPAVGGIVVNARDVTERIRLEEQLRQAQKLEAVGRLASSVAHDFNNILSVVLGNVRLASEVVGGIGLKEELADIEGAAERGAILARQLLAFSRPTVPVVQDLDLGRVVDDLRRTLRTVLPSSIVVRYRRPREEARVRLAVVQLEQVLLNLALNARDSMPDGGTLTLEVDSVEVTNGPEREPGVADGRWARLTVVDSGTGMDEATLARAFEPFFTTKPPGRGTGLGLATVKSIVGEANGQVLVSSSPHRGTTVTVYLPMVLRPAESPDEALSAPTTSGPGRVLLVEDEPALRRVLTKYLSRNGYEVYQAPDGVAALSLLDQLSWHVDLVLTDLVMPNLGGVELARRIGAARPDLPVLCMSGHPGPPVPGNEPWAPERTIAKPAPLELIGARVAEMIGGR